MERRGSWPHTSRRIATAIGRTTRRIDRGKLLLNRREIDRLYGRSQAKGLTVVPLSVYLKGNRIKVEIALAQGKQLHDKRLAEKERRLDREAEEAMASRHRGAE